MDKNQKKMTILVNDSISKGKEVTSLKKSKYIICPKCEENAKIKINNFKISLHAFKNGHKIDDLSLDVFNEKQYIDLSKIKYSKYKRPKTTLLIMNFINALNTISIYVHYAKKIMNTRL